MTIQPITYDLLREKGALPDEARAFCDALGVSVHLTVESAIEHAHAIDWDWAADTLLSGSAWDDYEKAISPARDAYYNAKASAWDDYIKAAARAWSASADIIEADASRWDTCDKARASAREVYNKARAEAFARAYLMSQAKE